MLEPTIYCTRGEHDNHYTTEAVTNIGTLIYVHSIFVDEKLSDSLKTSHGGALGPDCATNLHMTGTFQVCFFSMT